MAMRETAPRGIRVAARYKGGKKANRGKSYAPRYELSFSSLLFANNAALKRCFLRSGHYARRRGALLRSLRDLLKRAPRGKYGRRTANYREFVYL